MNDSARYPLQYPISEEEICDEEWQFYAEAFKSWRAWKVVEKDSMLLLQSITYRTLWVPRQEFVTDCVPDPKKPKTGHSAPNLKHQCGIYSLKDENDAILWSTTPHVGRASDEEEEITVYGEVSIWGHCYKFTKGYLSEFAYPARIFVPRFKEGAKQIDVCPEEVAAEISGSYRVKAVIK